MLNPAELDHLNRQIAAAADYLARRSERLKHSTLDRMVEAFRRQVGYRDLVEQENPDPRLSKRNKAA